MRLNVVRSNTTVTLSWAKQHVMHASEQVCALMQSCGQHICTYAQCEEGEGSVGLVACTTL